MQKQLCTMKWTLAKQWNAHHIGLELSIYLLLQTLDLLAWMCICLHISISNCVSQAHDDRSMGCLWHSSHLTASPQMELVEQSKIAQKHIPPFQILKPICSLGLDQSTLQEQLLVLGFDSHRSWVRLFLHLFVESLLARIVLISKLRKRKIMIVSWRFSFHYTTEREIWIKLTHSISQLLMVSSASQLLVTPCTWVSIHVLLYAGITCLYCAASKHKHSWHPLLLLIKYGEFLCGLE
jgi:hypothetical protein